MWYNIAEVWSNLFLLSSEGQLLSLADRENKFLQTLAKSLPDLRIQ
jgi:hypothetical protein